MAPSLAANAIENIAQSFGVPVGLVAVVLVLAWLARKTGPRFWVVLEGIAASSREAREHVAAATKAFESLAAAQKAAIDTLARRVEAQAKELGDLYKTAAYRADEIERQRTEVAKLEDELAEAREREAGQALLIEKLTERVEQLERQIAELKQEKQAGS